MAIAPAPAGRRQLGLHPALVEAQRQGGAAPGVKGAKTGNPSPRTMLIEKANPSMRICPVACSKGQRWNPTASDVARGGGMVDPGAQWPQRSRPKSCRWSSGPDFPAGACWRGSSLACWGVGGGPGCSPQSCCCWASSPHQALATSTLGDRFPPPGRHASSHLRAGGCRCALAPCVGLSAVASGGDLQPAGRAAEWPGNLLALQALMLWPCLALTIDPTEKDPPAQSEDPPGRGAGLIGSGLSAALRRTPGLGGGPFDGAAEWCGACACRCARRSRLSTWRVLLLPVRQSLASVSGR